jgi:hypothetical protein
MKTKYDSRVYGYGLYRDNYPRGRARRTAIEPGLEEWETYWRPHINGYVRSVEPVDQGPCWCSEPDCDQCGRYFRTDPSYRQIGEAQRRIARSAVHDPSPASPRPRIAPPCPHEWESARTTRAVPRGRKSRYWWGYDALSRYPEDPVIQVTERQTCAHCRKTREERIRIREATAHEKANIAERRRIAQRNERRLALMRQKIAAAERGESPPAHGRPAKKRRARKAGRRRK